MVYQREKEPITKWFPYIIITAVGTMGLSVAVSFGFMSYRNDDLMIKYGECLTYQTKLALKVANEQVAFLNAEVKSTSELLQCRTQLMMCKSKLLEIKPEKKINIKKKRKRR